MNSNITVGAKTYVMRYSTEKTGSVRVDTSTGLNTPTTLSIRQLEYKDNASKLPAHLASVKMEIPLEVQGGLKVQEASATLTLRCPKDSSVDYDTDLAPLVTQLLAFLTPAVVAEVFKDRAQ